MATVRVYVEGSDRNDNKSKTACRKGFAAFLKKAGFDGRMPKIIACGGRGDAYKSFCTALRNSSRSGEVPVLLVDSEDIVSSSDLERKWEHVARRAGDHWNQPAGAEENNLHFMAVCMEIWLVADSDALTTFFGSHFDESKLPKRTNLEKVSKRDIYQSLEKATRATQDYAKGNKSFELLEQINPRIVRSRCQYADHFLSYLDSIL